MTSLTRLWYPAVSSASSVRCAQPRSPRASFWNRSSTRYTSQPTIGLMPALVAWRYSSTAPAIEPWSVTVTAGISSSTARLTSSLIRHAPSRIEYSEWQCRWTKGEDTGRPL